MMTHKPEGGQSSILFPRIEPPPPEATEEAGIDRGEGRARHGGAHGGSSSSICRWGRWRQTWWRRHHRRLRWRCRHHRAASDRRRRGRRSDLSRASRRHNRSNGSTVFVVFSDVQRCIRIGSVPSGRGRCDRFIQGLRSHATRRIRFGRRVDIPCGRFARKPHGDGKTLRSFRAIAP